MGRHIVLSLSAALLFSCSGVWARSGVQEQSVPLKIYGEHLVVVQGSIGTLQKKNLVIDTGAYPSVIDRQLARKLNLSGSNEELDAIDRTLSRPAVVVPTVDLGPIHVTQLRSLVEDLSQVSERFGVRVDALIGLDVLAHSSFRIDYQARKLFFGPFDPLPSSVPFEMTDSKICVGLYAGPRSLRLLVDTGAEKLLLLGSHVPWLASRTVRAREFANIGGNFILREVRLDGLQLGDTNLSTQPVYVSAARMPAYPFDGFLSTVQFRQIAFDFERQQFSWVSRDERLDHVRIASDSTNDAPYIASFVDAGPVTDSSKMPREECSDKEVPGLSCGLR